MCTHLFRRGLIYYFRRRIPADLVQACGKSEIVQSLKTSNRAEAVIRLRRLDVDLDMKFSEARATTTITTSTSDIKSDIEVPHDDISQSGNIDIKTDIKENIDITALSTSPLLPSSQQVVSIVPALKIEKAPVEQQRLSTEVTALSSSSPLITMQNLYDMWLDKQERPAKTRDEYQLVLDRFGKDRAVAQVTKSDCIKFRDSLLNEHGLSVTTVNKNLSILSGFFNIAIEHEYITDNKVTRLQLKKKESAKNKRLPFDEASLIKIFTSPLYLRGNYPKACGGKAGYWLPILALFTGARLEELAQLRHCDIRSKTYLDESSNGKELNRWILHITDEGDGQKLKTATSIRRVPIHNVVIKLGFLEYLKEEKSKNSSSENIFPDLLPDVYGKISGNWSKWFGRYLRKECGVENTKMVFHSFRHTFKDLCRTANVEESVHDALTGHSNGSVSRSYGGTQYPLRPLVKAIDSLILPSRVIKILTHKHHN
ncbi:MAG: hypothetical protein EKE20_14560 [Candidatus Symbiopectobacterium sp. Dall1.0]|nr:hypothetical protein [Candidatus Symbiopectobacterium sp. Dall1.0]